MLVGKAESVFPLISFVHPFSSTFPFRTGIGMAPEMKCSLKDREMSQDREHDQGDGDLPDEQAKDEDRHALGSLDPSHPFLFHSQPFSRCSGIGCEQSTA